MIGKFVTAEAIANALGKSMIRVNYAEIESLLKKCQKVWRL